MSVKVLRRECSDQAGVLRQSVLHLNLELDQLFKECYLRTHLNYIESKASLADRLDPARDRSSG